MVLAKEEKEMIKQRITLVLAAILALGWLAGSACKTEPPAAPPKAPPTTQPQPSASTTAVKPAPGGAPTAAPATGKKLRFAFIPKALHIPVFTYAKTGAERMAKQLGNVEILWNAPEQNDQIKQKEILETFMAMGVDGIAISCLNGEFLTPTINAAVEKGIPVVTWDSDAPNSKRVAFYGVNDFESGVIMGNELTKLLGEPGGEIGMITTLGADNLAKRLDGAMSIIRQHPAIKVVETFDIEDSAIKTSFVIANANKTYPNLKAWVSVGGWPGFSRNILDPVDPKKTYVISFDTIPPAPELIKGGKIQLALGQKYFGWGSVPCRILYDIVVNKKYPENPVMDSGVDVVTPANVEEYNQKWKRMEAGEIVE